MRSKYKMVTLPGYKPGYRSPGFGRKESPDSTEQHTG